MKINRNQKQSKEENNNSVHLLDNFKGKDIELDDNL